MRPLLDPRMRMGMSDAYPSRCTIRQYTVGRSASNQPTLTAPTAIVALTNLACRMGPFIAVRIEDHEVRDDAVTETIQHREMKINGFYPQIQVRYMDAVVDGVVYSIRGVDADSQSLSTRINLEVLKP